VSGSNLWDLVRVPGDAIWGYGRYGRDELLPLNFDDVRHDTAAAVAALLSLGLPEGSIVVVTSTVADVGHFHPLQSAARELGVVVCNADASAMDIERVAMFLRLVPVAAVIGVNEAMVDGMGEHGHDPRGLLAQVPLVIANGAAQGRLAGAGVDALRFELIGPVLAFPCRLGQLHFDGRQWSLEEAGTTLHLSSRGRRALPLAQFETGLSGAISDDVCPCGRRDPVVILDGSDQMAGQS
jgi:hypothetical protein